MMWNKKKKEGKRVKGGQVEFDGYLHVKKNYKLSYKPINKYNLFLPIITLHH